MTLQLISQVMRLFALYRQAEMHRKALTVQKQYLQCQVDAFFQTQQSALLLMADMGAPVNLDSHPPRSNYPRAYTRFRAAGCVVIATLRFRYILRRKMHHLRSHMNKLQRITQTHSTHNIRGGPSLSTTTVSVSDENALHRRASSEDSNSRQPSPIGLSTGIPAELSGHPAVRGTTSYTITAPSSSQPSYPSHLSASPQRQAHDLSRTKPDSHGSSYTTRQFVKVNGHPSSSSMSHSRPAMKPLQASQPPFAPGQQVSKVPPSLSGGHIDHTSTTVTSPFTHKQKASPTRLSAKVPSEYSHDPQLTAYIKGLERLQARLSKTNMS